MKEIKYRGTQFYTVGFRYLNYHENHFRNAIVREPQMNSAYYGYANDENFSLRAIKIVLPPNRDS